MGLIPIRLLHEPLLRHARTTPRHPVLISHGLTHSYRELAGNAARLARYLMRHGLQRGDRVAIYTGNTYECAASIYGTLCAGGVFVVVHAQTKAEKLARIIDDCGARVLVFDVGLREHAASAVARCPSLLTVLVAGGDGGADPDPGSAGDGGRSETPFAEAVVTGPDETPLPFVNPLDLAALIYTSGSTGEPKGVMMTHQLMLFAAESISEYLEMAETDRIVNVLPLSFDYGLYQLLMTVRLGATLVLEDTFAYPSRLIHAVKAHEATVFPGVPTIFTMLVSIYRTSGLELPSVRIITNTAAALSDDLVPDIRRIFPHATVYKTYGLTECKRVSYLPPEYFGRKPGSVGRAIPGTEVFLRSPEGALVAPGEIGILHVRGPHVMLGYWNKREATRRMLRDGKYRYERVLCTGDWFRMDADGFLYFYGRTDDIIKSRGEKISPVEVENTIRRLQAVEDVAVVGVPHEVLGEAVAALVVLRPDEVCTTQDVRSHCSRYLEGYMVPTSVVFLDSLPKTPSGKVKKANLVQSQEKQPWNRQWLRRRRR